MNHCYRFDDVRIDVRNFQAFKGERALALEPKPLHVLTFLIENRGRLVEKRELMDAIWKDAFVTENVLSRAIAHLRKSLCDDAKKPRYIQTVPTRGYRFIANVEAVTVPAPHVQTDIVDTAKRTTMDTPVLRRSMIATAAIVALLLLAVIAALLLRGHSQTEAHRSLGFSGRGMSSQFLQGNAQNHPANLNT